MPKIQQVIIFIAVFVFPLYGFAQQQDTIPQQDTIQKINTFSGSLGLTNNGFSIIPTFSLNSPAVLVQLSWKKDKFSIDPDFRLAPDAKKGSMLFWFRYHAIQKKKFSLRAGIHPAFSLIRKEITQEGVTSEITQMLRFLAWEFTPNYQINKKWSVGVYYLQGNGLQDDGPRTSHFVNLNTSISNLNISKNIRLKLTPAIYYLYLDDNTGYYWTAAGILSHTKSPFTLQSAVNKTITSDLPNNKDFLWNVSIHYNFREKLVPIK